MLALVYISVQTHILGNYGNGIVGAGYSIYIFLFYLSNAGIPVALSKLVSEELALGNYKNAQKIFKTASVLLLIFGVTASAIMALGAHMIANYIRMPDAYLMLACIVTDTSVYIDIVCISEVTSRDVPTWYLQHFPRFLSRH